MFSMIFDAYMNAHIDQVSSLHLYIVVSLILVIPSRPKRSLQA